MKRILYLILPAAILFCGTARSQTHTAVYSGHVGGAGQEAVDYATVVLLQDDTQKAGGTTDDEGNFTLTVDTGTYTVVIQRVGYEPLRKPIRLSASTRETFELKPSAYALKEVIVQARNIERKADRFVVNVSPASGKDGTELLSQAPGVWLADDDISINGASGAKVFVNDREIKLSGEQLLSYLRALKSENIARIEVIPIAGAEYAADTRGGVIRIVLRGRQDDGIQGNVSMHTTLAPSLRQYSPSAGLNARIGKWSLNATAAAAFTPEDKGEMTSGRRYPSDAVRFSTLSRFDSRTRYGTGRFGAIFDIDPLNSIGGEIEYIRENSDGTSDSRTELTKGDYRIDSRGDYTQDNRNQTIAATFNYLHKTDDKGSLLKLIVDYANKQTTGRNHYRVTEETEAAVHDSLYRSYADATYQIVTSDLSWQKRLRKNMSLSAGAKYTHTYMDDYSRYDGFSARQEWEENAAYGYSLKYKENIAAAYASFAAEIGQWSLAAGVRGEYTRVADRSGQIGQDYFDLFPNLNATYAFDRMKKWMLAGQYARNIERPAFFKLAPNHIQWSDYSYQIGNPYLKPTYIHRFSVTLIYNYRYTVTVGGNLHRDLIREFCKQDPVDADISYITYENHDVENHWFVAVNLPFQPAPWCNLTANFVGVRQDIRMTERSQFKDHYLAFANATAAFFLPAESSVEVQYNGMSRLYSGNSEVAPRHVFNLVARKKLLRDRLWITASVNNLFDRNNSYTNNLDAYTTRSHHISASAGRTFKIGLTWNFNSGRKVKKAQIERGAASERERLKEK